MEVASEMTQYKHESSMEITDRTRTVVGVCLNVMYEQMYDDPRRNSFIEQIDSFIKYVVAQCTMNIFGSKCSH